MNTTRRTLEKGTYKYEILEAREKTMNSKFSGEVQVLEMTLMIDGDVKGYGAKIWLNESKTNKENLARFLGSLHLIAEDGTSVIDDWSELVGRKGKADFTPKEYNGRIYYNPSNWQESDEEPEEAPELEPVEDAADLMEQLEESMQTVEPEPEQRPNRAELDNAIRDLVLLACTEYKQQRTEEEIKRLCRSIQAEFIAEFMWMEGGF